MVLDEAQTIKNHASQTAHAVKRWEPQAICGSCGPKKMVSELNLWPHIGTTQVEHA